MVNLLLILLAVGVMALFYKQRQQSEYAKRYIQDYCQREGLQLLELFRAHNRVTLSPLRFITDYGFSYTTDGIEPLEGSLQMLGMRVVEIRVQSPDDASHSTYENLK
ncbi:DUF3301 domain-containing protein [Dongshaea marina]|uniref:DUF3301 domain-containing protein n=1 Tax=Dongshaea marina TaxID=2047966 RepID=UPI000D3EB8F5|nr:DUF3301 domain-containing protein [Dongshaea marina]